MLSVVIAESERLLAGNAVDFEASKIFNVVANDENVYKTISECRATCKIEYSNIIAGEKDV